LVSLVIYWSLSSKPKKQNIALLCICYFIYAYGAIWLLIVIFISTVFNYITGRLLGKEYDDKTKKLILTINILGNVAYLGVFKYFNFFSEQISNLLSFIGLNVQPFLLGILLPIGISFYTLQVIAYNIDVYRKDIPATTNFITFAVFVAYFPKLTAGPIDKSPIIIAQIESEKSFKDINFSGAWQLLLLGYFKKIVIADIITHQIAPFYENPLDFGTTEARIIIILFTIQILVDFSAYSDIARGISRLFGIELMINFNQPYLSTNVQEFWRRWHISLSEWFRDYMYKPLGGNRKGFSRLLLNLMIIFVVSGFWHGVGLTFIIWGFLHGVFIVIYRINTLAIDRWKGNHQEFVTKVNNNNKYKIPRKIYGLLGLFITFQLVNFAWIFFRAPDVETALLIIERAYFIKGDLGLNFWTSSFFGILLFACIIVLTVEIIQYKLDRHEIFTDLHWVIRGICYALLIIMILTFFNIFLGYEPFIYEGF